MNTTRIYGYTSYYLGLMRAGILCKNTEVITNAIDGLACLTTKKVGQTISYFDGEIIVTEDDIKTIRSLTFNFIKIGLAMKISWNETLKVINKVLIELK